MPRVFIPPLLQTLTGGVGEIDCEAANVREVVEHLDGRFPGIRARLCDGDELKPGLTVAVDGHVSALGLIEKAGTDAEIHFLPAVGGG